MLRFLPSRATMAAHGFRRGLAIRISRLRLSDGSWGAAMELMIRPIDLAAIARGLWLMFTISFGSIGSWKARGATGRGREYHVYSL